MKLQFSKPTDDDLLTQAIDADAFAAKLDLDIVHVSDSGWSSACCPMHHEETPSFGIDLNPQSDTYLRWRCFHDDSRGGAIELVSRVKETSREHARELLFEWFDFDGIPAPDLDDLIKELEKRDPVVRKFKIPLPRTCSDTEPIVKYLVEQRSSMNYDEADAQVIIDRWGLKYSDSGYYAGRIIIPMYEPQGRQVYFQAQAVDPSMVEHFDPPRNKRKLFPSGSQPDILHGLHLIEGDTVIIVEGYFDACALQHWGLPGVMANSASLSGAQIDLLVEYATKVIVWFDNDVKDGKKNTGQTVANKACLALQDAGLIAYRVEGPANTDPDEVGSAAEARKIIKTCSHAYKPRTEPGYDELEALIDW